MCFHHSKQNTVYVRNAMTIVQSLQPRVGATFNTLASGYADGVMKVFAHADTVVDVFDRYDNPQSVKALERARRESNVDCKKVYQVIGGRFVPPWTKFLGNSTNKMSFNEFIAEKLEVLMVAKLSRSEKRAYFIAGAYKDGKDVNLIACDRVNIVPDLFSTQEEADTRMILHMSHANEVFARANVAGKIIVRTHDTDVLLLCIYYFPQFSNITELWMEAGYIGKNYRLIPVHELCDVLPIEFINALPAIHAITGCDTTSALAYIGKNTVYDIAKLNSVLCQDVFNAFIGHDIEDAVGVGQLLVAKLYDKTGKLHTSSLDKMRSKISIGKP